MLTEEIPITCPSCGYANSRTAAQIRSAAAFKCKGCGKPVELNKDTLLRTTEDTITRMRGDLKGESH